MRIIWLKILIIINHNKKNKQKDMKKVLIIAQNEAKANDAASHFSDLTVRKVFPGVKRFPRHFDAVVIYFNEANEVNFIKDEI